MMTYIEKNVEQLAMQLVVKEEGCPLQKVHPRRFFKEIPWMGFFFCIEMLGKWLERNHGGLRSLMRI